MRIVTLGTLIMGLSPATVAAQADAFHMTVRDAFTITDQGTVITGIVEGGRVAVEDVVCLRPAEGEPRELTVSGILQLRGRREELTTAEPGTIVGLRFASLEKDDVKAGDRLTADCD